MAKVIVGTGSFLPTYEVGNAELVSILGQKSPQWVEEKTGIHARRFLKPLEPESCRNFLDGASEIEMATAAAKEALSAASLGVCDVDRLIYVTCTSGELHFGRPALLLHQSLGLRGEAWYVHLDAGCGGVAQAITVAMDILCGREEKNILLVASNAPSIHIDRRYACAELCLSPFIFGDGAGAFVLTNARKGEGSKILAHYFSSDSKYPLMYFRQRDGIQGPVYEIDGVEVKKMYAPLMARAFKGINKKFRFRFSDISRFYFHQANLRLIEAFCEELGVPLEKVAINVNRYGNLSAAATMVLFDEDLRRGILRKGDICLFAVVGAGAQYGAFLVEI